MDAVWRRIFTGALRSLYFAEGLSPRRALLRPGQIGNDRGRATFHLD